MTDRAVSTSLNYSLTLAISTLLVVGLLTAGGTFVDDQRTRVVDSELEVIGERLAADIATADRLAQTASGSTDLTVTSELPGTVSGSGYTVEVIVNGGDVFLELSPHGDTRSTTVEVANRTDLTPTTVSGGTVDIEYDDSADELEVTDG